jgi:hypothetical protein
MGKAKFDWTTAPQLIDISMYDHLKRSIDEMATHLHSIDSFNLPIHTGGEADNADRPRLSGTIAISIQRGIGTAIEVWKGSSYFITLLEVDDDAFSSSSGSWDFPRLPYGTSIVAVIKSSAINCTPEEISIRSIGIGILTFDRLLTAHNSDLRRLEIITSH